MTTAEDLQLNQSAGKEGQGLGLQIDPLGGAINGFGGKCPLFAVADIDIPFHRIALAVSSLDTHFLFSCFVEGKSRKRE
jgi:hypothetical protein